VWVGWRRFGGVGASDGLTSRSGEYQFCNGKGFVTNRKLYSKTTHVSFCHRPQPASSCGAEEPFVVGDRVIVEAHEL